MNGDMPIGFIPTGWDVSDELEFDDTDLGAACRHAEPTP
jgi:hypothetical protein